jgi:hypothetical protein
MTERPDTQAELNGAIHRIIASDSRKKLVVAGPGAGKTYLFSKLLAAAKGEPKQRYLRNGLSAQFRCYPGLRHIIPQDWEWLCLSDPPHFIDLMRNLNCSAEQTAFYMDRTNYYDAVDFDDSVYRINLRLSADISKVPEYALVLIDEFQDFNKMEASIIDLLAGRNSIVIAGDDDQALYSQLRSASCDHIRARYLSGHYEIFELPFCLRCPEVIVNAVSDIIERARVERRLNGRIPKPYRYYEPVKGEDSARYPHIELVETTVQRLNANYFGRYIEQSVQAIPPAEFASAAEKNEPVALIIASNPYRQQVEAHLLEAGLLAKRDSVELTDRQKAFQILSDDPKSNLGWRIMLASADETVAQTLLRRAHEEGLALAEVMPASKREEILADARKWSNENPTVDFTTEPEEKTPSIVVTSYEGSKGRSAQYVFLVGLHSGELPSSAENIKDIEICRFVVGLTRTKKKCSIIVTKNAMGKYKNRSEFLSWINPKRYIEKKINAAYWNQR